MMLLVFAVVINGSNKLNAEWRMTERRSRDFNIDLSLTDWSALLLQHYITQ